MNVLLTGSSGLIGSNLVPFLSERGHKTRRLVRGAAPARPGEAVWDPAAGSLAASAFEGIDAVVHLAGEPLASGRWTPDKKDRILRSREDSTRLLADTIAALPVKPRVVLSASAVGIYGDRGDGLVDENAEPGAGFLADVCGRWERAAQPVARSGVRLVLMRIGVVLTARGGALAKMLPPFRLGLGGVLGDGRQYMSWIALDDVLGAVDHLLENETIGGPVNVVAPKPVTNREFTKTLGRVLGRPTVAAVPKFAARLAFGELADEALLSSTRAIPAKLVAAGYAFEQPELEGALRCELSR